MTDRSRTPTPEIDQIWERRATRHRWHQLWIDHLHAQIEANPNHPGASDIEKYQAAADRYWDDYGYHEQWDADVDQEETVTRHDLVAELNIYNRRAGATTAHLGLTSHDIVDHANQIATKTSMHEILVQTSGVIRTLAEQAKAHREALMLERTHGQPAQASLYGLRIATILSPLIDWFDRCQLSPYHSRPPYGAVGTAADIVRVLETGWGRQTLVDTSIEIYEKKIIPSRHRMLATRQTYHRSYDLHIAGLLLELASIAQTWANDRRLETLLGLGGETRDPGQVGSSAMPLKRNPVIAERIVGLCSTLAGYHEMAARSASTEWLGGDVSGSSTRRTWLPGIFQTASALLINWVEAQNRWQVDTAILREEVHDYYAAVITGPLLQQLVDRGVPRPEAHRLLATHPMDVTGGMVIVGTHSLTVPRLTIDGLGLRPAQSIIDQVVHAAGKIA